MPPFWITTSWDDGHPLDMRIAHLLHKYGVAGTFYIARDYLPKRITEAEIVALGTEFEIGAHTLTHPSLSTIPLGAAQTEISQSRQWLQSVTGDPISAFCYPRGDSNAAVQRCVERAGFEIARTVVSYHLDTGRNPFEMPTTLQVYPFPLRPVNSVRARFERVQGIGPHVRALKIPLIALRSWTALALALLNRAAAIGGIWHLWGHSWEIERYAMWDELEYVLSRLSDYSNARFVTNTQAIRQTKAINPPAER